MLEYINGVASSRDLALRHNTRANSTIINWVSKYNRLEVIKDYEMRVKS